MFVEAACCLLEGALAVAVVFHPRWSGSDLGLVRPEVRRSSKNLENLHILVGLIEK